MRQGRSSEGGEPEESDIETRREVCLERGNDGCIQCWNLQYGDLNKSWLGWGGRDESPCGRHLRQSRRERGGKRFQKG